MHANRKLRKGEATEEERKTATQFKGTVLPISKPVAEIEYRQITDEEKKFNAYHTLRRVSIHIMKTLYHAFKCYEPTN